MRSGQASERAKRPPAFAENLETDAEGETFVRLIMEARRDGEHFVLWWESVFVSDPLTAVVCGTHERGGHRRLAASFVCAPFFTDRDDCLRFAGCIGECRSDELPDELPGWVVTLNSDEFQR